jgi:hypothetical protein
MELKPDLEDLVLHAGVKGMKWDPSKKKSPAEVSSAWMSSMLPKDQVLPKDKIATNADVVKTVSSNAAKSIEKVISQYADKKMSEIFGKSDGKPHGKIVPYGSNQLGNYIKPTKKTEKLTKEQIKKNKDAWKNAKTSDWKDKLKY